MDMFFIFFHLQILFGLNTSNSPVREHYTNISNENLGSYQSLLYLPSVE